MSFEFYARGATFQERAPLKESIQLMQFFHDSIHNTIETLSPSYFQEVPFGKANLYLEEPSVGSLDFNAVVEFIGATVMSQPELLIHLWDVYNKSSELIQFVSKWFKENGSFPTLNIVDSFNPIFVFNIGSGSVDVSKNVHDISVKNNESLNKLARKVRSGVVAEIDISPVAKIEENDKLTINKANCSYYRIPSNDIFEPDFVEIPCGIYRLNTKTGKGKLELLGGTRKVPFEILSGNPNEYIEALKYPQVLVRARREVMRNALGEVEIKRLFLSEVIDVIDDGEMK